jgi:hypothetical protein
MRDLTVKDDDGRFDRRQGRWEEIWIDNDVEVDALLGCGQCSDGESQRVAKADIEIEADVKNKRYNQFLLDMADKQGWGPKHVFSLLNEDNSHADCLTASTMAWLTRLKDSAGQACRLTLRWTGNVKPHTLLTSWWLHHGTDSDWATLLSIKTDATPTLLAGALLLLNVPRYDGYEERIRPLNIISRCFEEQIGALALLRQRYYQYLDQD